MYLQLLQYAIIFNCLVNQEILIQIQMLFLFVE